MRLIATILLDIKEKGFFKTLFKITKAQYNKFKYNKLNKKIFSTNSIEDKFTKIFKLNYWGNNESVSGGGSSLESTKNIRHKLPQLINQFQVTSILDAPCGDFYWMAHVMKNLKIQFLLQKVTLHGKCAPRPDGARCRQTFLELQSEIPCVKIDIFGENLEILEKDPLRR